MIEICSFCDNPEWFRENPKWKKGKGDHYKNRRWLLTEKAPKEAIESYNNYYSEDAYWRMYGIVHPWGVGKPPLFLDNKKWYKLNPNYKEGKNGDYINNNYRNRRWLLTEKAPKEAIESYNKFYHIKSNLP